MKIVRLKRIILFLVLIMIGLYILVTYFRLEKCYSKRVLKYKNDISFYGMYSLGYETFFTTNFHYPFNMNEINDYYKNLDSYKEFLYYLDDPFSNNKKLLYLPVFSRKNRLIESYLLISAGIDGEINTSISDTLFKSELNELNFYNHNSDSNYIIYYNDSFKFKFRLINALFGKKDLLFSYIDGVNDYINNAKNSQFSVLEFSSYIKNFPPIAFNHLECLIEGTVTDVENGFVIIKDSGISIHCNMYKGRSFETVLIGDYINIACQYKGEISRDSTNMYFENCIVVK